MQWLFSQQAFAKGWFLPYFTVYVHQARIVIYENYAFKRATWEILSLNFTAMELSYDVLRPFLVWGLPSDDETVIGNRRLHMLESPGTHFLRGLPLFLLVREMELWSVILSPGQTESQEDASWGLCVQRLGAHNQMTSLIFICQFLASFSFLTKCNSSHLETLLRFSMKMFKYFEFEVYKLSFRSISSFDRRCPSPLSSKHRIG